MVPANADKAPGVLLSAQWSCCVLQLQLTASNEKGVLLKQACLRYQKNLVARVKVGPQSGNPGSKG
jgi:hypothetical protein